MQVIIGPQKYLADIRVPNILSSQFNLRKSQYPYYEILCGVIREIHKDKNGNDINGGDYERLQNLVMFEIDNKIQALNLFNDLLKKYCHEQVNLHNAETFSKEQNVLALLDAYLNSIHSLRDFMLIVDKITKYEFTNSCINPLGIFAVLIDLRNIFHHNQSPFVDIEDSWILLKFNQLPKKPTKIQIFPKDRNGYYSLKINPNELTHHFYHDFNQWAKSYLDLIPSDTELDIFIDRDTSGKWNTEKHNIKELIEFST